MTGANVFMFIDVCSYSSYQRIVISKGVSFRSQIDVKKVKLMGVATSSNVHDVFARHSTSKATDDLDEEDLFADTK